MNIRKIFLLAIICLSALSNCKEEIIGTISKDDSVPDPVTNVNVENLPGEVKLTYTIPKSKNLLYIEAECNMGNGRVVKSKASYYKDFLYIEGFGDTTEYNVTLYAVGRNFKRSSPYVVKVKPSAPPVWGVFESLEVFEDFGGIGVKFDNIDTADIAISVETIDSLNNWILADVFYTKQATGVFSVRGLKPKKLPFRIFVNDRWNNQSEVLETELVPLYEEKLDKNKFRELNLPGDAEWFANNIPVSNLWNNSRSYVSWFRTQNGSGIPNHINFDLGVKAKLSRFVYWQRGTVTEQNLLYTAGSPLEWEVWGSNQPNQFGTYDGWIKLMECRLEKPSGQPVPINSNEDIKVADDGHEFKLPIDAPAVRYIRIKVLKTFGNTDYFWMDEFNFFGQVQ